MSSFWLTPLNFLAAYENNPSFTGAIDKAMQRSYGNYQIPGTTIVGVDVSGSMRSSIGGKTKYSRFDAAFALAAVATYIFEDPILCFTAGSDYSGRGKHLHWTKSRGLDLFNDKERIYYELGGGIFTRQFLE